jgi:hypothetical protein
MSTKLRVIVAVALVFGSTSKALAASQNGETGHHKNASTSAWRAMTIASDQNEAVAETMIGR